MPISMPSFDLSPELSEEPISKHTDSTCNGSENGNFDFAKLLETRPRSLRLDIHRVDAHRSLDERSLSDLVMPGLSPRLGRNFETVKSSDCLEGMLSPSARSASNTPRSSAHPNFEPHPMVADAWEAVRRSLVYFRGKPVGTIAALDSTADTLNYNQVFVRDFFPSALAFLMNGEPEIV
eukprot:c14870_g2_i1 orf=1-534(-)